jgi:NAD(P)-dependent dehydrogenase (short-subunit alcohol dehydrogenase family)
MILILHHRFNRIDLIFCNAGILPCSYLDWSVIIKQSIFNPVALLSRTDAIVQPVGETTAEGLGRTFACNVFGHYVMVIDKLYLCLHHDYYLNF